MNHVSILKSGYNLGFNFKIECDLMYIIFNVNVHCRKKYWAKVIFQAGNKNMTAKVWNRKCCANLTLA